MLPDPFAHALLLGVVDGGNDLRLTLPQVQKLLLVVRGVDDLERFVEEAEQLILPLDGQRSGGEDQTPVDDFAELEFLDEEAGHDGLARAWVVREQKAQPGLRQHLAIDRLDLMQQGADAGQADRELTVVSVGQPDA